jgi:hypothetical protein
MRVYPTLALLCAAVLLAGTAGPGGADNTPALPDPIKLPGTVTAGVVRGEHFCAVTAGGNLIDVDLPRCSVRDLGTPGGKLVGCLDVAGGKAVVASADHVYLVDLPGGKTVRSLDFAGGVCGVGLLGEDRVFVQTGCSVEVLDLAAGKVLHSIATTEKQQVREKTAREKEAVIERERVKHCRVGRLLYAGNSNDDRIAVIDLGAGKVLDRLPADSRPGDFHGIEGIGGIQVVGEKLYVEKMLLSYGVWVKTVGQIDLTTKKYTRLRLPGNEWVTRARGFVAGPDGTVLLTGHDNQVWQSDAAGNLAGPVTLARPGTLVGAWNGQALVVTKDEALQLVPLAGADKKEAASGEDPWSGTYTKFEEYDFPSTAGRAPHITITRDEDGYYHLSKPYDSFKFVEVEKGVLEDSGKVFGRIYLGSAQFVAGPKKPATVLRADFCYEHFHLWR